MRLLLVAVLTSAVSAQAPRFDIVNTAIGGSSASFTEGPCGQPITLPDMSLFEVFGELWATTDTKVCPVPSPFCPVHELGCSEVKGYGTWLVFSAKLQNTLVPVAITQTVPLLLLIRMDFVIADAGMLDPSHLVAMPQIPDDPSLAGLVVGFQWLHWWITDAGYGVMGSNASAIRIK